MYYKIHYSKYMKKFEDEKVGEYVTYQWHATTYKSKDKPRSALADSDYEHVMNYFSSEAQTECPFFPTNTELATRTTTETNYPSQRRLQL